MERAESKFMIFRDDLKYLIERKNDLIKKIWDSRVIESRIGRWGKKCKKGLQTIIV